MVMPTRILEIAKTRQGESRTPFTWTDVKRNVPIEDWRFTEDMPRSRGGWARGWALVSRPGRPGVREASAFEPVPAVGSGRRTQVVKPVLLTCLS